MGVVIAILVVAVLLSLLGIIVKSLIWLLFIGLLLAAGAFLLGATRRRNTRV